MTYADDGIPSRGYRQMTWGGAEAVSPFAVLDWAVALVRGIANIKRLAEGPARDSP